ncbi:MAG: hypothetical protein GF421_08925 [Candidatus Aminicenantes bacterium]|nr:hypothetical protein [Candidatus Aminicenantes bacterium]
MHEIKDIEFELIEEANRISKKYKDAPVIIIVGGYKAGEIERCMTAS